MVAQLGVSVGFIYKKYIGLSWLKQENFNNEINKYLKFQKFQCNDCAKAKKDIKQELPQD